MGWFYVNLTKKSRCVIVVNIPINGEDMNRFNLLIISLILTSLTLSNANAFWIWTPKSQKLVNPKYAVKDTPEDQYEWAMFFYESGDYVRAAEEFNRLVDYYENSKLAPEAQYYAAVAYRQAGKYYKSFENYQKVIKQYPYTDRIEDIIKAEYELGEIFYDKNRAVLMGVELMADVEKGIEIFDALIENMPYSKYADKAQFMIGLSRKKIQQYTEAVQAFEKVVQEYPTSDMVEDAKYEIAQCMYLASNKAAYDQETTDDAIKEFKKYANQSTDELLREEAEVTITILREKKAGNIYETAHFYERQKKYKSAFIYYREIVDHYNETSFALLAEEKIKKLEPHL